MTTTTTQGLLATCCLDRTIHLWGIENLAPRGSMVGHTLGVRALAYASSVLVSAGFEVRSTSDDVARKDLLS